MAKPAKQQTPLEVHRFASIFPPMVQKAFKDLADDIVAKGLVNPIVKFEDKVLDGVHRQVVCVETDTPLRYEEFKGTSAEALAYVVSANLHRRHLSARQRAGVALKLANLKQGGERKTKSAKVHKISRQAAATALGVSKRIVDDMAAIHKHGAPELVAAVGAESIPVKVAADLTHAPKEVQSEVVEEAKRSLDDKGKPTRDAQKRLKTAGVVAKASSGRRKGKAVPKIKGSGKSNDPGPSGETFKSAVYGFAADLERYVIQSKWLALLEHEKLPPKRREEVIRYLRGFVEKVQALHDKLEGQGNDLPQEQSAPLHTAAA